MRIEQPEAAGLPGSSAQRLDEGLPPGSVGGEVKGEAPGAAGEATRQGQETAAQGAAGSYRGARGPDHPTQRKRLWAREAIAVQAALAVKRPEEGKWASAWSFRSRIVSSTTACRRSSASMTSSGSVPVGDEGEVAPLGEQLGLLAEEAGAAHEEALLADDRLGDLMQSRGPALAIARSSSKTTAADSFTMRVTS